MSRRLSQHSHGSDDSDPLEPLELALSAGGNIDRDIDDISLHTGGEPIHNVRTATSIGSSASRPPDFEVSFDPDDKDNPRNWPRWYRAYVVFAISFTTWVVILYSTSYTASIPGLMIEFGISNTTTVTLGVTTYLFGLAVGSLVVAPASELYGRRPVYIAGMTVFTILVIPCCLAQSLASIIIVRFFG